MTRNTTPQRWVAAGLLASATTLALAGAANADPGARHDRAPARWSGWRGHWVRESRGPRVWVRDAGPGPAIAGLIGGFILGAATHPVVVHEYAEPVVVREPVVVPEPVLAPERDVRYYDPYCDRTFDSLDEVRDHFVDFNHPRLVRVVDARTGEWLKSVRWYEGGWHDEDRGDPGN